MSQYPNLFPTNPALPMRLQEILTCDKESTDVKIVSTIAGTLQRDFHIISKLIIPEDIFLKRKLRILELNFAPVPVEKHE